MCGILEKEELAKVLVHRDQGAIFARSPFQNDAILSATS